MKLSMCFILVVWLSVPAALAGAAPGLLNCVSVDRKAPGLTVKGSIPAGIRSIDLAVSYGDASIVFTDYNQAQVIERFPKGVFTLSARDAKNQAVTLYAIPKEVVIVRREPQDFEARFVGVLNFHWPATEESELVDRDIRDIAMSCVYRYGI